MKEENKVRGRVILERFMKEGLLRRRFRFSSHELKKGKDPAVQRAAGGGGSMEGANSRF